MAFRRANRAARPRHPEPRRPEVDPRTALFNTLVKAGEELASACGVCGATVAKHDPEAVQTWRERGTYPHTEKVRSWRYHGLCAKATNGPQALALLLAHPEVPQLLVVGQAHADVARRLGGPLLYSEREKSAPSDRGRVAWKHVPRVELEELRAAVERRRRELAEPVHSPSGLPCAVCGVSHELLDKWGKHRGRPVCAACMRWVGYATTPGNDPLEVYAARVAIAADAIPPRREVNPFPLASSAPDYRPLMHGERRKPWAYLSDTRVLPVTPPTPEERLAELEARLGAAA